MNRYKHSTPLTPEERAQLRAWIEAMGLTQIVHRASLGGRKTVISAVEGGRVSDPVKARLLAVISSPPPSQRLCHRRGCDHPAAPARDGHLSIYCAEHLHHPAQRAHRRRKRCRVGRRFGRLKVLREIPTPPNAPRLVRVACKCGEEKEVLLWSLTRTRGLRSCGCLKVKATKIARKALALRVLSFTEQRRLLEAVEREGIGRLAKRIGVKTDTIRHVLAGKPVQESTYNRLLIRRERSGAEVKLLARITSTPVLTPAIERWGEELGLTCDQVWEALEAALERGELARDLTPAGVRWRKP